MHPANLLVMSMAVRYGLNLVFSTNYVTAKLPSFAAPLSGALRESCRTRSSAGVIMGSIVGCTFDQALTMRKTLTFHGVKRTVRAACSG